MRKKIKKYWNLFSRHLSWKSKSLTFKTFQTRARKVFERGPEYFSDEIYSVQERPYFVADISQLWVFSFRFKFRFNKEQIFQGLSSFKLSCVSSTSLSLAVLTNSIFSFWYPNFDDFSTPSIALSPLKIFVTVCLLDETWNPSLCCFGSQRDLYKNFAFEIS